MLMCGYRQAHIKQESAIIVVLQTCKVSHLPVAMGRAQSFGIGGNWPAAGTDIRKILLATVRSAAMTAHQYE